jgi:hypothetical protein
MIRQRHPPSAQGALTGFWLAHVHARIFAGTAHIPP